jgi:hypothetical protein
MDRVRLAARPKNSDIIHLDRMEDSTREKNRRVSEDRDFAPPALSPGSVVGHYVLQQQIGAGSGGVAYRALDHRLQRAVALKILDAYPAERGATWGMALQEARAAGALAHPNICAIYDVEEVEGLVYIAMELVEGRTLHATIPGHGLTRDAVVRYGAQIASALAHAHEKGVCHGDVSSKNVMLTLDDRVKVLDFGLAGLLSKSDSPAEPPAGARRDLQQLGILLCEMATGEFPPQALEVLVDAAPLTAVLDSAPVVKLPRGLRRVIARCLEKDPKRSYQRAEQAAADLEAEIQGATTRPLDIVRALGRRGRVIAVAGLVIVAMVVLIPIAARHARRATPSTHTASPVLQPPAKAHPAQKPGAMARPNAEVWVNTKSRIYHCANSALYGKTEQGKRMTQGQAQASGYRPARGEFCH